MTAGSADGRRDQKRTETDRWMAGRNHPERNAAEGRAGAAKERQGAVGQRGAGTSEGRDEKDRRASEKERIRRTDALVKEFQGAYNATKEQQEKYKISIEKVQKQREVYQKLFQSFLDAQAGLLAQELKEGCPARYVVLSSIRVREYFPKDRLWIRKS